MNKVLKKTAFIGLVWSVFPACQQLQDIKDAYFPEQEITQDTLVNTDTVPPTPVDSSAYYLEELPQEWREVWAYAGNYAFLQDCNQQINSLYLEKDSTGEALAYFTRYGLDTTRVEVQRIDKYLGSEEDYYSSNINYSFTVGDGSFDQTQTWQLQMDSTDKLVQWYFTEDELQSGNGHLMVAKPDFNNYVTLPSGPCLPDSCTAIVDAQSGSCAEADSLLIGRGVVKMLVVKGGIYQFYDTPTAQEPTQVIKLDGSLKPKGFVNWLEPLMESWEEERLHLIYFQEKNNRLQVLTSKHPYRKLWVDRVMVEEVQSWKTYWTQQPSLNPIDLAGEPIVITKATDPTSARVEIDTACIQAFDIQGDWLAVRPNAALCPQYKKSKANGFIRWKERGEVLLRPME